jgi:hypothetical protein
LSSFAAGGGSAFAFAFASLLMTPDPLLMRQNAFVSAFNSSLLPKTPAKPPVKSQTI